MEATEVLPDGSQAGSLSPRRLADKIGTPTARECGEGKATRGLESTKPVTASTLTVACAAPAAGPASVSKRQRGHRKAAQK